MTLRERAADAMRLKDAELRGVVGAPSWGHLTTTDQDRWLALHDAGAAVRDELLADGLAARLAAVGIDACEFEAGVKRVMDGVAARAVRATRRGGWS